MNDLTKRPFPHKFWILLISITLIKILVACTTALGNDEVYYWSYALKLEWNYFDHPPLVAWLIRATTLNLKLHHELFVRLGAIISSACCGMLLFNIAKLLANEKAGWYAALLYGTSFYGSIIAGTFILPDSPQMVFWLLAIYLFLYIHQTDGKNKHLWLAFGLACGLCMLCKIHGVFIWFGALLFVIFQRREWLNDKYLYLAMGVSLLIFSPVISWNIRNHFITYTYHSGRVSLVQSGVNLIALGREIVGSLFYSNPVLWFLTGLTVVDFFRRKDSRKQAHYVLIYCSLPLICLLLVIATFRDTLPHWSGPAYVSLIPLVAVKLSRARLAKRYIICAWAFFLTVVGSGLMLINYYPGTLSANHNELTLGKGDPSLDLYGWQKTGILVDSVLSQSGQKAKLKTIIITKWFPAAHLDFYACRRNQIQTYGIGEIFDLHQYYWSNADKLKPTIQSDCYVVTTSNLFDPEDLKPLSKYFSIVKTPIVLPIYRNGEVCKNVLIFKLSLLRGQKLP